MRPTTACSRAPPRRPAAWEKGRAGDLLPPLNTAAPPMGPGGRAMTCGVARGCCRGSPRRWKIGGCAFRTGTWVTELADDVPVGRKSCGWSSARSGRTRVPRSVSPTPTACGRTASPPTPLARTPIAAVQVRHRQEVRPRTASAPPACATIPSTTTGRIKPGSKTPRPPPPAHLGADTRTDRLCPAPGAPPFAVATVLHPRSPGHHRILRLARHWPWSELITDALDRLQSPSNPRLTSTFPALRAAPPQRSHRTPRILTNSQYKGAFGNLAAL